VQQEQQKHLKEGNEHTTMFKRRELCPTFHSLKTGVSVLVDDGSRMTENIMI